MNTIKSVRPWRLVPLVGFMLLGLSACSGQTSSVQTNDDGGAVIKVQPPTILSTRAINPSNLSPRVSINGNEVAMNSGSDEWTGSAQVPINTDAEISIRWVDVSLGDLLLAQAEKKAVGVNSDIRINITDDDYRTSGTTAFDVDEDGVSNLDELRGDTNPNDPNDPSAQVIASTETVRIRASTNAAVVDGFVDSAGLNVWGNAVFTDLSDNVLRIDNLLIDEVGTYVDNQSNFQWSAFHNEEYLTLFVYGKALDDQSSRATNDSDEQFFQDDSLEIFIDGNLSQGRGYDEVDDLHIVIPLVMAENGIDVGNRSNATTKKIQRGVNVNPAVVFDVEDESNIEFATCLCTGPGERVTWEVRINLAAAKIPLDKPFGFELQINQDDDGEVRDAKWAWHSPSKLPSEGTTQADRTWVNPSQMGKIKLSPFPN